ncbi:serine/threonine protein kinase [Streptomyces actinomycinicus]|uniref:non-specific serine/threonine protein kinase n=1 Tax=Streptomyces actinomycinicus TaxID=1695166 RepID=A0A937EFH1_9ACTN|nr:serine/threonine-protein kinase [Streptomyces actinomycinicus]MBL1081437.1 serine/threonine protein kinase [Streptomyces actinomycinicus]
MSSDGGAGHRADDTTSFVLQPPRPRPAPDGAAGPLPAGVTGPVSDGATGPVRAGVGDQVPPGSTTPGPEAGRLVAGRYRLLGKLGHGGMGTVWRAKDEAVDREVAVKEPRIPDHLPERERANAFERMRREARAAARLDHPAVVNVHDVAVVDDRPWIVMELVHGPTLGSVLRDGTLDAREAARIGLRVLGALEAAHAAGVLHRDVKPDNILLGRHDRVVLTDFGIAWIEGDTRLTDTGGFVGSPEYIAPERVLGQRPGPASDLWSLGVVLYTATEGVSPFRRSNTPATLQSVLNATPAPPAAATGPLAEVINGLLHKDPAHRPTADRVRALLQEAANPPAPPAPTPPLPAPPVPHPTPPVARSRRRRRIAWLGAGAAAVAAAVTAYFVLADPFAGPLPDGWVKRPETRLGVTLAVPAGYQAVRPEKDDSDRDWVTYGDWSGSLWIRLQLVRRSEDSPDRIKSSARAQMYDDNEKFKSDGDYDLHMGKATRTVPDTDATFRGRQAAGNTVTYPSDGSEVRPRELRIFYYRTKSGDMYELAVSYPAKGDFTARGREVAKAAIANLDITKP